MLYYFHTPRFTPLFLWENSLQQAESLKFIDNLAELSTYLLL